MLADPRIGAELVGQAFAGGSALIRVNAANGVGAGGGASRQVRAGPATSMQITIELPEGVAFASINDPNWICRPVTGPAELACDLPGLADGARSSADIKLAISRTTTTFSLTPMISADGSAPVPASGPLVVEVSTIPDSLVADYDRGAVLIVGNSSMTCDDKASRNCITARNPPADDDDDDGNNGNNDAVDANRQAYKMIYVTIKQDLPVGQAVPFNASTATLALGNATVTKAFLVWGGDTKLEPTTGATPDPSRRNQVRFVTPDGVFHDIKASDISTWGDDSIYSASADVTALVQKSGTFRVLDIQAAQGTAGMAGWSLVVVTHDPSAPMRFLSVTTPNATVIGKPDYSLKIPLGPRSEPRKVSVAVASFEGDRGRTGDRFTIGSKFSVRNAFNSSVIGAADPVNINNFGVDSDLFTTEIADPDLVIGASSDGDQLRLAMFAIAADL